MSKLTVENQVRSYIFELKNCANEYGFKVDGWELCMGTASEKEKLEKKYYPTFSARLMPELLTGVFLSVKEGLQLTSPQNEMAGVRAGTDYLIAYNPSRLK
ncbi:hypothetical protein [Pedobacter sp. SYSU D00535]|uniref:hypothetical protein n=1 Tax=Pedobacter sp. SYSU D00535 TaxID=2810308 RepID=UPI001A958428|nr:hypothetical protein [Pedobacter sp. SYSU D00535]